jgi:uncharacterized SAM-binding protein YcdF (DUF218 family)
LAGAAAVALLPVVGLYFAEPILCADDGNVTGDVIVVLGGDTGQRSARALQLYQHGAAPRVIVSGRGDCDEMRVFLTGKGVPVDAIQIEPNSSSTRENAMFSVALMRQAQGAQRLALRASRLPLPASRVSPGGLRVVVVTSWFHSRRALKCFRHYAPEMEFVASPTVADRPKLHWPNRYEQGWVLSEYVKLLGYWVCYGV